jgi:hypothetical protein
MLLNREKFIYLTILWSAALLILLLMLSPNVGAPGWLLWPLGFGLIFGTKAIIRSRSHFRTAGEYYDEPRRKRYDDEFPGDKPKRDFHDFDDDPRAMLEILDEDDREELRREIKERLQERIESGSDEEVTSLEALLADLDNPSASAGR